MPSHRERVKTAPLPAGYQFGESRWRAPHLNTAEQLARFHDQQVVEAQLADCEPFDANRDPGDETT